MQVLGNFFIMIALKDNYNEVRNGVVQSTGA